MIDKTQSTNRLIAQDADLIDLPAIAFIADGLTENMRIALLYAKLANDGSWWIRYSAINRTTHSLRKRGIVGEHGPLTPLGLAVRNHLKGLPNDQ
jgi:hypothetical protein